MQDFGIEIECILPRGVSVYDAASAINTAGVPCHYAGYSHELDRLRWKVVTDASLQGSQPGDSCCEIVSPPMNASQMEQIEKVCAALGQLGARVNRSCGLHVHIEARTLQLDALKRLAVLYVQHEELIDRLLPPSRRGSNNQYLRSITGANMRRLANANDVSGISSALDYNSSRYVKLNYTSFWRHGTVEFRHHSGTVDAQKIIRWIGLCQKLVDTAVREAAVAAPAAASAGGDDRYWRAGRRRRALYSLLTRPQGVTQEELRVALNLSALPSVEVHLRNAGLPHNPTGRREGHPVYRIREAPATTVTPMPSAAPVDTAAAATLEALFAKLQLTAEEVSFWRERASLLETETGPMPAVSNTMRRAGAAR